MKNIFLSLISTALIFLCSNCNNTKSVTTSASPASGSEALYQSEWKLTEVQGKPVPVASTAVLTFTPGQVNKVTGSTGCNRLNGNVEVSGTNTMKFSPLAVTRMACLENGANETEQIFLAALERTSAWSIVNNELLLKNGAAIVAKLQGKKPLTKDEAKLNGSWELNYISGAKIALDGLFPNKKPLIVFDLPKPEATGNGGCNGFSCKVKVEGNKITFGDALSTMMACDGNGEPVFFQTLKKINRYSISDDNILTMIMGDIAMMRFVRK